MAQNHRKEVLQTYKEESHRLLTEMSHIVMRARRKQDSKEYSELLGQLK